MGNAENWVGVINTATPPSRGGSTAVARTGRTTIASAASHQYTANDFVCKDDANAGDVIDNGSAPCPIGESVGVAVGDASSGTSHAVDLVPGQSVSGAVSQGLVLQFTCAGADSPGATTYLNGQTCATTSGTNSTEFNLPYQSGTYTFKNLYVSFGGTAALTDSVTLYIGGTASTLT